MRRMIWDNDYIDVLNLVVTSLCQLVNDTVRYINVTYNAIIWQIGSMTTDARRIPNVLNVMHSIVSQYGDRQDKQ